MKSIRAITRNNQQTGSTSCVPVRALYKGFYRRSSSHTINAFLHPTLVRKFSRGTIYAFWDPTDRDLSCDTTGTVGTSWCGSSEATFQIRNSRWRTHTSAHGKALDWTFSIRGYIRQFWWESPIWLEEIAGGLSIYLRLGPYWWSLEICLGRSQLFLWVG